MEKAQDRLLVLEKIKEYERKGYFDRDVENDPPTRLLKPGEVDYVGKKLSSRLWTGIANECAKRYFDGCIKRGELIIKEVKGIENYLAIKDSGAIITCNHFNPFDNYAVFKVIQKHLGKRRLYKIIREGNYTTYKGLFGFFFRHCNTLPLATNYTVCKEMIEGVDILLRRGEKILIYPEQAMWWNYRKPRPLKNGAFQFAVRSNVPVLPFFITMADSDKIGENGFPHQEYTVHILPALTAPENLKTREKVAWLAEKNFEMWKNLYEEVYGEPLTYSTEIE